MKKAIFPGSFDPATNGHLNIIGRASEVFDELIVLIVYNSAKETLFTVEERAVQLERAVSHLKNVRVDSWNGLTVAYAEREGANIIVRGLRSAADFDYELRMAEANRRAVSGTETVFMPTAPEYSYISSSVVKEFLSYGADVSHMVHEYTLEQLHRKFDILKWGSE